MTVSDTAWKQVTLEESGLDSEKLKSMDREIFAKYPNVLSALIIRDDSIVYEHYYRDNGPDNKMPVMSVNKSILSALIGIALDKSVLSGLDQLISDFFPEAGGPGVDPQVRRLTLRYLLTMTSGFYYPRLSGDAQPVWARTTRSPDWVEFSLSLPIRDVMGQGFNYKNTDAFLAAACLSRAAGKPISDLAQEWLFTPLGITVPKWVAEDPQGLGIGKLSMTARDMARFGLLYLHEGAWNGEQIISQEWVKASTSRQTGNYGFLWWVHDNGYSASGAGGALIRMIPSKKIIVVFQSKHLKRFKDPRELVDRFVVPAVKDSPAIGWP